MPKTLELPRVEFITSPEGKPKSVVLSIEDWKRITETLKIMSNKELVQSIRRAKQQLQSGTKFRHPDAENNSLILKRPKRRHSGLSGIGFSFSYSATTIPDKRE